MKIELWVIGKTRFAYLKEGIELYSKRLRHYTSFHIHEIPDLKQLKKLTVAQIKEQQAKALLAQLPARAHVVLLDEGGKQMSSQAFARFIEHKMNTAEKKLLFVVGGAYGFAPELYERAQSILSLSAMTFSHQMVRLFFVEQLYRAMTILRNEPYHHQ